MLAEPHHARRSQRRIGHADAADLDVLIACFSLISVRGGIGWGQGKSIEKGNGSEVMARGKRCHSHNYKEESVPNIKDGQTLMINPGTIGGVGSSPATYVMVDLETMETERCEISKSIEKDALEPVAEEYAQPSH